MRVSIVDAVASALSGAPRHSLNLSDPASTGFVVTFAITLVQGTFVNILLGILMLLLYAIQRSFCRPPEPAVGRCEKCGYNLRASYEFGRCPECGTPCTPPAPAVGQASPHG